MLHDSLKLITEKVKRDCLKTKASYVSKWNLHNHLGLKSAFTVTAVKDIFLLENSTLPKTHPKLLSWVSWNFEQVNMT